MFRREKKQVLELRVLEADAPPESRPSVSAQALAEKRTEKVFRGTRRRGLEDFRALQTAVANVPTAITTPLLGSLRLARGTTASAILRTFRILKPCGSVRQTVRRFIANY